MSTKTASKPATSNVKELASAKSEAAATTTPAKPAAKAKRERNMMGIVEKTRLAGMIEAEYARSRLNDAEFAEHATKKLGFDVPVTTVTSVREAFKIAAPASLTLSEARARIRELEDELAALKSQGTTSAAQEV